MRCSGGRLALAKAESVVPEPTFSHTRPPSAAARRSASTKSTGAAACSTQMRRISSGPVG